MKTKMLTLLITSVLMCTGLSVKTSAQVGSTLTIVDPAPGTVVQAGGTIQVSVNAVNPSVLSGEALVSSAPLPQSSIQAPATMLTFSVSIPADITPGVYYITAFGKLNAGGTTQSSAISIVVPPAGVLTKLTVNNTPLTLRAPGNELGLEIQGAVNGQVITLNPIFLKFAVSDPNIISVDRQGFVTAQHAGQAQIVVTYVGSSLSAYANVHVLGGLRGDLNGDGRVDISDVNILTSLLGTPANGQNDARDLNHDGKIDALDARILVTLCTYPRCATHP